MSLVCLRANGMLASKRISYMAPYGFSPMKTLDRGRVSTFLRGWPIPSREQAIMLIKKYGLPHEASDRYVLWHYNNPWLRTVVWRTGYIHTFPKTHTDIVEQTLNYDVPVRQVSGLLLYNGSIIVNQTRAELSVCCGDEAMNFLAMNLAHEILLGIISPQEAWQRHKEMIAGSRLNWPEAYMEELQFMVVPVGYGVNESGQRRLRPVRSYEKEAQV